MQRDVGESRCLRVHLATQKASPHDETRGSAVCTTKKTDAGGSR